MTDIERFAAECAEARAVLRRIVDDSPLSAAQRDGILGYVATAVRAAYMEGIATMRQRANEAGAALRSGLSDDVTIG